MKANEIKVGGLYRAAVNGVVVTVLVDAIRKYPAWGKTGTAYDVTNLKTGRKTTFRSAAKFRGVATVAKAEAELRADPVGKLLTDSLKPAGGQHSAPVEYAAKVCERGTACLATMNDPGERCDECGGVVQADPPAPKPSALSAKLAAVLSPKSAAAPHLVIVARAGTGKTTTLIEGLKVARGLPSKFTPSEQQKAVWDAMSAGPRPNTVAFVAFNSSIAKELKDRVPPGCDAMTNHSLGLRAVRGAFRLFGGDRGINEYRVDDIIAEILGADIRQLRKDKFVLIKATRELVGLCKMNLTDPTEEALRDLADYYEVELGDDKGKSYRTEVFALVPKVLERCKDVSKDGCVDFDDMIWLPVALDLPVARYDLLLVDEAQDLNRCQQALAKKAGRRLVLCGDPKQAIYGFAGADARSMDRMTEELGATDRGVQTLPLTVTRRCGKAIVAEAKKLVKDFEAFDANGEGRICRESFKADSLGRSYRAKAADGDMVLCRVNAPLVSECFRFIKAGRKATIQGRNVGQGLVNTVRKCGAADVRDLIDRLGRWCEGEVAKENAKKNPSEAKIINIQDKFDCLMCFVEGLEPAASPDQVIGKIDAVFTDDKNRPGVRLSSIHKAKGLEAGRVFLLEPEGATVPHPMAKSAWQVEQEWNLRYVAITRAIEELVYVS